jgi:hypothetical protein
MVLPPSRWPQWQGRMIGEELIQVSFALELVHLGCSKMETLYEWLLNLQFVLEQRIKKTQTTSGG